MTVEMEHTFEPLYVMQYDGWIPVAEIDQFGNTTINYKLERFEVQLYSHFMKPKIPITIRGLQDKSTIEDLVD